MILLAANYHYVSAAPLPAGRAIFPTSAAELEMQIRLLGECFDFVSRDDLLDAVAGRRALPEYACVVTFDDGLRCQVEVAAPLLDSLGIPAIFFVSGQPLAEGRPQAVHLIHHLRDHTDDADVMAVLEDIAPDAVARQRTLPLDLPGRMYRYDTVEAAWVKYLLAVTLPADEVQSTCERLFCELVGSLDGFCEDLYMDAAQVADLERASGAIGAHGFAHRPLRQLPLAAAHRDMVDGADVLERVTGRRPRLMSYPYGSESAVDRAVADAAASLGMDAGLSMERSFNRSLDDPMLLARLDVNDMPGGSRPLFDLHTLDVVEPGMTSSRRRYIDESIYESTRIVASE
ncbi:MAG: polysaccharide deacetylase family protein [Solirubrobacteraceae bacterium]